MVTLQGTLAKIKVIMTKTKSEGFVLSNVTFPMEAIDVRGHEGMHMLVINCFTDYTIVFKRVYLKLKTH